MEAILVPITHKFNHQLAYLANNKAIWDNLRDRFPHPYTIEDAIAWVNLNMSENNSHPFGRYITIDAHSFISSLSQEHIEAIKKDNDNQIPERIFVGSVGGELGQDVYRCTFEIGYYLGEPFWGRGIGTKALSQMVGVVFDHYPEVVRIYATPYKFNEASKTLLKKVGFSYDGCLRCGAIKNGVHVDCEVYSMLRGEYSPIKK